MLNYHHWYLVQCKAFGFVRNKNEGIVVSTIIKTNIIPDMNVLMCMDEDIIYVGCVHNNPKVWTIHIANFEWAQYHCLVTKK